MRRWPACAGPRPGQSAGEAVAQGQGPQRVAIDGRRSRRRVQRQHREGQVLPTRGGRARDRTERPVPVHDLLSRLERRVAFEQRQPRSEEHTSELQSLMRISYAVFCLKKKKRHNEPAKENITSNTKE